MLLNVEVQSTHHHPTQFDIGHKLESEFAAVHLPSEISVSQFCILVMVQAIQQTIKNIAKGTTDSRVEFCFIKVTSFCHITTSDTNLDQISISET